MNDNIQHGSNIQHDSNTQHGSNTQHDSNTQHSNIQSNTQQILQIVEIQALYIEASELMDVKKYFVASQKLELATQIYQSFIDSQSTAPGMGLYILQIQQLHDKISLLLRDLHSYLHEPNIIDNVILTEDEKMMDMDAVCKDIYRQMDVDEQIESLELDAPPMTPWYMEAWDAVKFLVASCFLPLQRRMTHYYRSKLKYE